MMLARRSEEAERAGERAMAIAESIGDTETLATTAIERGISRCVSGDDSGLELIERGMAIAAASDMERFVAYGYSQIGSGYGELRRYDIAMPALHDGIDYKEARE
jgi:hypothetical protein